MKMLSDSVDKYNDYTRPIYGETNGLGLMMAYNENVLIQWFIKNPDIVIFRFPNDDRKPCLDVVNAELMMTTLGNFVVDLEKDRGNEFEEKDRD